MVSSTQAFQVVGVLALLLLGGLYFFQPRADSSQPVFPLEGEISRGVCQCPPSNCPQHECPAPNCPPPNCPKVTQKETISNNVLERFRFWKSKGFEPKCAYDVGANVGQWSLDMHTVFNNAQFYMFEGNGDHAGALSSRGFPFAIGLIGDEVGKKVKYMVNKAAGNGQGTGNSMFRENTEHYRAGSSKVEERELTLTTLDQLTKDKGWPTNCSLLKIDVQGAEKLVLGGAKEILKTVEIILLELAVQRYNEGAPLIAEVMAYLDSLVFRPLDITEMGFSGDRFLLQVDFIFARKDSPIWKSTPYGV